MLSASGGLPPDPRIPPYRHALNALAMNSPPPELARTPLSWWVVSNLWFYSRADNFTLCSTSDWNSTALTSRHLPSYRYWYMKRWLESGYHPTAESIICFIVAPHLEKWGLQKKFFSRSARHVLYSPPFKSCSGVGMYLHGTARNVKSRPTFWPIIPWQFTMLCVWINNFKMKGIGYSAKQAAKLLSSDISNRLYNAFL